jgi:hypothetical protein
LHANDCPEDNPKTVSAKYVETEEAKLADDGCRDSNWLRTTGRIRTAQKLAGSSFQCSTALSLIITCIAVAPSTSRQS